MVKRIKCTKEDVELIVSIMEFWGEYSKENSDPVILEDDGFIVWTTVVLGSNVLQDLFSEGFRFSISASIVKSGFIRITFSRWE
jgi:hypothetical protein